MSTIKVDNLQTTSGVSLYPARAWVTYEMDGTASIISDAGVSSLSDLGTGEPQFTLSNALSAANGSCWNTPALYTGGQQYAVQAGGFITSTTVWRVYCGSNTTTQADWDLGYSGLIR